MKAPVEIEVRRASFTLSQFREGAGLGKEDSLGSRAGASNGPIIPFHIIARVSVTRVNCDRDRPAIFFRSSFLVVLSVLPPNSSLILPTSRETCTADISGKLCDKIQHPHLLRYVESTQRFKTTFGNIGVPMEFTIKEKETKKPRETAQDPLLQN